MANHKKPVELKRVNATFKIQGWMLDWLRNQDVSQGYLIEQALIETYALKPPKVKG